MSQYLFKQCDFLSVERYIKDRSVALKKAEFWALRADPPRPGNGDDFLRRLRLATNEPSWSNKKLMSGKTVLGYWRHDGFCVWKAFRGDLGDEIIIWALLTGYMNVRRLVAEIDAEDEARKTDGRAEIADASRELGKDFTNFGTFGRKQFSMPKSVVDRAAA